ncbi:MAG: extracellular solute-binding protein [Ruminococcaceae bacterium]|nr:extracellular solute-binding protein [Oscillospiraceae bacterium]
MSKKIIAVLLSLVMVMGILALTGCNANNSNNAFAVPETGFNPDEVVEITFTHTMGAKLQEVLNTYIAEFNKLYPNIHITHQSAGGWGDINGQINTEIAGGNQPNIAYCYPDHVAMYNIAKSVVTLDNLIASDMAIPGTEEILGLTDAQKADFIESYYNEGLAYGDGLMYTMPLNKSTEVLYYDKDFFTENNLTVPTTWEEMWETCEKILAIDPDCYPLGYDAEDNWFITLCEQMETGYTSAENGGEYLFNNDANKAFVKELREYYQKGYFTTQELYGSYTSNLFVETTDTRCYMCIGSSGGASYQMSNNDTTDGSFAFEVGVAPIPQYNAENRKVISQGPSLCILQGASTTDQQILASWLFVKFLCTNVDFQAEFSMASGYMPVLKSVTENENYANWLAKGNGYEYLVAKCVQIGIDGRDNYFVSPAFNGSSTARTQVGALLLKCLSGEAADDAAVDALINTAFQDAIDECEY